MAKITGFSMPPPSPPGLDLHQQECMTLLLDRVHPGHPQYTTFHHWLRKPEKGFGGMDLVVEAWKLQWPGRVFVGALKVL